MRVKEIAQLENEHRKRRDSASFAVGLDGVVYISVLELDGVDSLDDAVAATKNEKYFIGVPLARAEVARLLPFLKDGGREAAGHIAGGRHWKKK